jgi:hypothetical protein
MTQAAYPNVGTSINTNQTALYWNDQPNNPLLDKALAEYERQLHIDDWQPVEAILGFAAARYVPGKPIWIRIIKPSGAGGTTLIQPLLKDTDSILMGSLTEASTEGKMHGGVTVFEVFSGKRAVTPDLAKILSKRSDKKRATLGGMRDVYDGYTATITNRPSGYERHSGQFDWISATTATAIEGQRVLDAELGQRFIDLRLKIDSKSIKHVVQAATAAASVNKLLSRDEELGKVVRELLQDAKQRAVHGIPEVPDYIESFTSAKMNIQQRITELGLLVPVLRSNVRRDYKHDVVNVPEVEVGTRLVECLCRLIQGIALVKGKIKATTDDYFLLLRIAADCIPSIRRQILAQILQGKATIDRIESALGYKVQYHLEDMRLLGIIDQNNNLKIDFTAGMPEIPSLFSQMVIEGA